MGSKLGGAPSSLVSPPSVVCCMCGDYGLSRELFRCKVCLVRSQHKYCSDLYPKVEFYRACNWCLREEGGKLLLSTSNQNPPLSSSSDNTGDNSTSGSGSGSGSGSRSDVKLHRRAFSSHLNKPVKKQRLPERSSPPDVTDKGRGEQVSPTTARARQVFRGKVRRYKLLEEVSS